MKPTYILGLSCYYHDSAAALIRDGEIIAAAQEERFTRIKGDEAFPHHAVDFCLTEAGITIDQVDHIAYYENPFEKFDRLMMTYHLTAPSSWRSFLRSFPAWITKKIWLENEIQDELGIKKPVQFCDHHLSHGASAFFPSPFQNAAVLTVDGVGEWATATYGVGEDNKIKLMKQMSFPNSLGLLYSAFTFYTGFKINSGEYKLMGLAPYGRPLYVEKIKKHLIHMNQDGSIVMNQDYFDYVGGLQMTNAKFHALFEGEPRKPESTITQREMDLAASIQEIVNEALVKMATHIKAVTKQDYLVLAGGVALNVVATGLLSNKNIFKKIWIQPAAGDAGGALGSALWLWYQVLGNTRVAVNHDAMKGAFLGTFIRKEDNSDDAVLKRLGGNWEALPEDVLQEKIATRISEGKIVAVARGKMEFGPRALGARSILGDARSPVMQKQMNLQIKFRESFRPFAPMVLEEDAAEYFDISQESPYMLLVYPVKEMRRKTISEDHKNLFGIDLLNIPRSEIPAVTHVDFSARVQTIDERRNPFIYGVISRFKAKTGCPVIVNTSFNVRGEPIVNTAEDAYRCFMATEIDCLVVGNRFFEKDKQQQKPMTESERDSWLQRFELD